MRSIPVLTLEMRLGALQLGRAVEIYSGMVEGGVVPSKEVYTSLVHACSKDGDVAKALAIYADMRAAGIMPDEVRPRPQWFCPVPALPAEYLRWNRTAWYQFASPRMHKQSLKAGVSGAW